MSSKLRADARETFTIVLGILIAFGLDSGWETFQERRQEDRLLQALANELVENVALLDEGIRHHARLESNTGRLLQQIVAAPANDTIFVPDSLLYSLMAAKSVNFSRGELEAAVSSGRIDLIHDPRLRSQVAGMSGVFDDLAEDEQRSSDLLFSVLLPGLSGEMELSLMFSNPLTWADPWPGGWRWVHVTEATRSLVGAKFRGEVFILIESRALRETMLELVRSLEAEAGR